MRAGTPFSSITRLIPASIDSLINHWQIGVVPPGKCERSSSQWPGLGATNVVVMFLLERGLGGEAVGERVLATVEQPLRNLSAAGAGRYVFGTLEAPSRLRGDRTIHATPTRRIRRPRGTAARWRPTTSLRLASSAPGKRKCGPHGPV